MGFEPTPFGQPAALELATMVSKEAENQMRWCDHGLKESRESDENNVLEVKVRNNGTEESRAARKDSAVELGPPRCQLRHPEPPEARGFNTSSH